MRLADPHCAKDFPIFHFKAQGRSRRAILAKTETRIIATQQFTEKSAQFLRETATAQKRIISNTRRFVSGEDHQFILFDTRRR